MYFKYKFREKKIQILNKILEFRLNLLLQINENIKMLISTFGVLQIDPGIKLNLKIKFKFKNKNTVYCKCKKLVCKGTGFPHRNTTNCLKY